MAELTLAEAQERLAEHGGYDWLLSGKQFWSVSEIVASLTGEGMKVSNDAVSRWVKALPHTLDFGRGPLGLQASRLDLVLFFASRMRNYKPRNAQTS